MTMNRRQARRIHNAPRSVRTIRFLLRRSAGDRQAMPIALERSLPSCAGRYLISRFSNSVMSDFVTSATTAITTMAANRPAALKLLWAVAIDRPTAWREPRTSADNGADSGRAPRSRSVAEWHVQFPPRSPKSNRYQAVAEWLLFNFQIDRCLGSLPRWTANPTASSARSPCSLSLRPSPSTARALCTRRLHLPKRTSNSAT
jgi:hypothetical protein